MAVLLALVVAGCSGADNEASVSGVSDTTLEEQYLAEVNTADADAFASNEAALLYLKNLCQAEVTTDHGEGDRIDQIVASYCDTELAVELGVKTQEPLPAEAGVDEEAFAREVLETWGIGAEEEDGSKIDVVAFARSLCDGDVATMISNLGDDFEGSFQEFALTTFCPDKLP